MNGIGLLFPIAPGVPGAISAARGMGINRSESFEGTPSKIEVPRQLDRAAKILAQLRRTG